MARTYDNAQDHRSELPGDLPRKAGATHIGMFFAWCVERGLISDWHARNHPDEIERLARRWYSGRDYLLQFMEGTLTAEHLNEQGQAFAAAYVASGRYLVDYEAALRGTLPSLYHVSDTWEVFEQLVPVLDAALGRDADPEVSDPAPAVDHEPEPEPEPEPESLVEADLPPVPDEVAEPEPAFEHEWVDEPEPELAPEPEPEAAPEETPVYGTTEPTWNMESIAPGAPTIESEPLPPPPEDTEFYEEPEDREGRDDREEPEHRENPADYESDPATESADAEPEAAWSWEDAMGRLERTGERPSSRPPPPLPPELPHEPIDVRRNYRSSSDGSSGTKSNRGWIWVAVIIFMMMYGCKSCSKLVSEAPPDESWDGR